MVTANGNNMANNLVMQVNLYISGRELKDLDLLSRTDPKAWLFERGVGRKKNKHFWIKIGETEQLQNTLNPDFSTSITMPYYFEKEQHLKITIIDGDGFGEYDKVGEVFFTLGNVMGARAQTWQGKLTFKNRP